MVSPSRASLIQSAIRHAAPDVVPFQVKTTSLAGSTCAAGPAARHKGPRARPVEL
jgi:hypothetical protein